MPRHVLTTTHSQALVPSQGGRLAGPAAERSVPLLSRRRLLAGLGAPALLLATPAGGQARERRRNRREQAPPPENPLATFLANEIEVIFWNLDGVRNLYGLPHLHRSWRLDQAAFAHAQDIARTGVLSHFSSDGTDVFRRILNYYPFETWLGENVAVGYGSGLAVLDAWRASPGHNANLLNPAFHAVGLACVAQSEDPAGWFWVADFGGVAE